MIAEANLTVIYILAILFIFGVIAAWICKKRGRSAIVGFALGMAFGFVGLIIANLLPEKVEKQEE